MKETNRTRTKIEAYKLYLKGKMSWKTLTQVMRRIEAGMHEQQ